MNKTLSFLKSTFRQNRKSTNKYSSIFCLRNQEGSAVFYILIAIALLGMLSFAFMDNSGENSSKQNAYQMSEQLYTQFNIVNSAIMSCVIEHPKGGGDLDSNGTINAADNDNRPYPLSPSDVNNPSGAAINDWARNMKCPGSGLSIFQGSGSVGNYLAPPPAEFTEWELLNDNIGVRLRNTGSVSSVSAFTVEMLQNKFDSCRTELNLAACGANCITIWIKKIAACP